MNVETQLDRDRRGEPNWRGALEGMKFSFRWNYIMTNAEKKDYILYKMCGLQLHPGNNLTK